MHHSGMPGQHFGHLHPFVFREIGRHADELILDCARGRHVKRFGQLENDVGLGNPPALREGFRRGSIGRLTFDRAAVDPSDDLLFLAGSQRQIVREISVFRVGRPRRHLAREHCGANRLGPGASVFEGQKRHGSRFARTVAALAAILENRLYVLMKCWSYSRYCANAAREIIASRIELRMRVDTRAFSLCYYQ